MTQVLKREDSHGSTVRSLDFQPTVNAQSFEEQRIAELQGEVADLQRAIADAEGKRLAEVAAARKQARDESTATRAPAEVSIASRG